MKSYILTDKAVREIILALRIAGPNRSREVDREYARQLIARFQKENEPEPKPKPGRTK